MWEEPAENPYVVVSWDIPIRQDAVLGLSTIGLRFVTYDINGSRMYGNDVWDGHPLTINVLPSYLTGDFDHDDDVDVDDIDLLCDFIRNGTAYDEEYDISADGTSEGEDTVVDLLDLDYLVRYLVETTVGFGTEYGDFNLDGHINTTDLTRLSTN